MKKTMYTGFAISTFLLLAGCGQSMGACKGVDMDVSLAPNFVMNDIVARIKNSSSEAKLVTVAITEPGGIENLSGPYRVAGKDVVEESLGKLPKDQGYTVAELKEHGISIKIKSCE